LAGALLAELDSNGNTLVDYIYLEGKPVGQVRSRDSEFEETAYIHTDHIGSSKAATNQSGEVIWQIKTTPFGEVYSEAGTLSQYQRFPGQYADQESDYSYNYFRDYDPSTGRYIQSDPIGLRGGLNTYGYVGGNPINLTDPSGLCPWCVGGAVGFFTGAALEYVMNDNASWMSALEQGIVVGAAGAASAGASLLPAIAIAVSATSAKESYDSYQKCGDLSQFDGNSVLASDVGTLLGGLLVKSSTKLCRINIE
jgi:RHS repeat-associated protein